MVQIALQVFMAIFEIVIGRQGISSNPWCLTGIVGPDRPPRPVPQWPGPR
jgi:hypothetical protein